MVTSDQQAAADERTVWRESVEAGIRVHWTPVPYDNSMSYSQRIRAFFQFAWRAARKAAQLGGDLVFATSTPLTIALPAVYAARRTRVPMVFEVRDLWPAVPIAIGAIRNPLAKWAARRLERFAYRNASRVVALAPGMRDEVVATGYPAARVAVIPNGCDLDVFDADVPASTPRQEHAWLGERPLLVFIGTFGLVNGMGYLVRLAAAIAPLDAEIRIAAVGTGREYDNTRKLAEQLQVLNRNFFLLGKLPKRQAAAWMQAADMSIALFTGPEIVWRDAVQNKFFDSLAAGKPVANNFPGWQAKIAVEAGAGLILSADDIDAAARAVVGALRDRTWMEQARKAARQLAEQRYNRDLLAAQLAQLLEETVGQRR
jgi:glycosyltransferase involved in cell wall biosynthesis